MTMTEARGFYSAAIGALCLMLLVGIHGVWTDNKVAIATEAPGLCGIYCKMAQSYSEMLHNQSFDRYYLQKSLHSAVVHATHKLTGAPLDAASVNRSFDWLRMVLGVATIAIWLNFAVKLRLTIVKFWFGAIALSVNQMMLFDAPAVSEDPDPTSVMLSLWFMYAAVAGSYRQMLACFLLVHWVQPQLSFIMMPILVFHASGRDGVPSIPPLVLVSSWFTRVWLGVCEKLDWMQKHKSWYWTGVFILVLASMTYWVPVIKEPYVYLGGSELNPSLAPIGIILGAVLLGHALAALDVGVLGTRLLQGLSERLVVWRVIHLLALKFGVGVVVAWLAQGPTLSVNSSSMGSLWLFYSFFFLAVQQPLKPWLAHLVYYGPVAILVVLHWRQFQERARSAGLGEGAGLSLVLIVLLSVGAESRHLVSVVPWLLILALVDDERPTRSRVFTTGGLLGFIALSLLVSRMYVQVPVPHEADPWLATWGPWWSWNTYATACVIGAVTAALGLIARRYGDTQASRRHVS